MDHPNVPAEIGVAPVAEVQGAMAYDAVMVPALMAAWTARTADAARIAAGDRVLDVACGTGALTREIAPRVGAGGSVTGLDASRGMLTVAWQRSPELAWRHGSAMDLPFDDGAFDAVVCQFGLMFFSDRRRALREMARVLAPGGRVALTVWDALEQCPAYAAETILIERLAGTRASEPLRSPFALGDRRALTTLVRESGFADVDVRTHRAQARFASLRVMLEVDLRGWLPVMGVELDEPLIARILEAAEHDLAHVVDRRDGAVFDVSAHIVSANAP